MNRFTSKLLIVYMLLVPLLVSGCWNYREVGDLWIVAGVALDKNEETDKYMVTVEIIKSRGGQELQMIPHIVSAQGNTLFDAIRNVIMKSGKKLYWSHTKIMIFSESMARDSTVPPLDFITRDGEARTDIWLAVSKYKDPSKILTTKTEIFDAVSFKLDEIMKAEKNISKYVATEAWKFHNDLSEEGISPVLPTIYLVKDKDKLVPEVYGTAIFKKDKMIGWINGIESRSVLIIHDNLQGGIITLKNVSNSKTDASLEIFGSSTKLKPTFHENDLVMKIDVTMDVGIAEISGEEDFISKSGREKLKIEAEELMKKQIQDTLTKVQKQYKSDIFGFGSTVHRQMPDVWKDVKQNWEEIFENLETQVDVKMTIIGSALTSKPIKVEE